VTFDWLSANFGPWVTLVFFIVAILAAWYKDTLLSFIRGKATMRLEENGAELDFERRVRERLLAESSRIYEFIEKILAQHEKETERILRLYEAERLDRQMSNQAMMEHAATGRHISAQSVEIMVDQVDVLRQLVNRMDRWVDIAVAWQGTMVTLRTLMEHQAWLLVRCGFVKPEELSLIPAPEEEGKDDKHGQS